MQRGARGDFKRDFMYKIFLGLGTNIGDRKSNLEKAVESLAKAGINVEKMSGIYETEPIGVKDQDWFYNMVVKGQASLTPEELLKTVKNIEKELGRTSTIKWGPRVIDIDLLLYDDLKIDKNVEGVGSLKLPHPQLKNRAFVIKPLLEIEPEAKIDGEPIKKYLSKVKDQKVRRI